MKKGILAIVMLLGSTAFANKEIILDTKDLSCQQAIRLVKNNGIKNFTVFGEGPVEVLSRDAANDFCSSWERAARMWLPTADAKNCPVGYTCVNK